MKHAKPDFKDAHGDLNEMRINYGRKRSILRKLMIAQRRKFQLRKEIGDALRIKNSNLADTSMSNCSQASENEQRENNMK